MKKVLSLVLMLIGYCYSGSRPNITTNVYQGSTIYENSAIRVSGNSTTCTWHIDSQVDGIRGTGCEIYHSQGSNSIISPRAYTIMFAGAPNTARVTDMIYVKDNNNNIRTAIIVWQDQ